MGIKDDSNRNKRSKYYNSILELLNKFSFLKSVSKYSNKKIHSYLVLILIFYLSIYTDKVTVIGMLLPVYAAILGLREYAKNQYNKNKKD